MNKLLNDEIECNMFDDECEKTFVPKSILDGYGSRNLRRVFL
jgi:hypothetical protein